MASIRGTVSVRCPACGAEREAALVQSINARAQPADKQRLLAGELNVMTCACGRRTPLAATLVFHDPDHDYYGQVVPGDEAALAKAAAAFRASGASGTKRIVRSQNELVEKIKILDAGLADWAIEMAKVLLAEGTLLFDRASERELHWVKLDRVLRGLASPRAQYEQLASRAPPPPDQLVIDRAWAERAVAALRATSS
jgi:hypothetical protein